MEIRTEKELILTNVRANDAEGIITQLADLLLSSGYVKDSFRAAVLEREKVFATGLPTPDYHVAIPHTDAEHVIKPGFAVGVLSEPVSFGEMGTTDSCIDIDIVCMLALNNNEIIVKFLGQLIALFQKPGFLKTIAGSAPEDIAELFNNQISI